MDIDLARLKHHKQTSEIPFAHTSNSASWVQIGVTGLGMYYVKNNIGIVGMTTEYYKVPAKAIADFKTLTESIDR
jgi:hypothetical protein